MAQNGSQRKNRAIEALVACGTVAAAAEQAKVPRRTLTRWLHEDADFQQALQAARADALRHGSTRICALINRAVDTIAKAIDGRRISKRRYLSSKFVVEACLKIQAADFDCRITQLEERVREDRQRRQVDERRAAARYIEDLTADQLRAVLRSRVSDFEENP